MGLLAGDLPERSARRAADSAVTAFTRGDDFHAGHGAAGAAPAGQPAPDEAARDAAGAGDTAGTRGRNAQGAVLTQRRVTARRGPWSAPRPGRAPSRRSRGTVRR